MDSAQPHGMAEKLTRHQIMLVVFLWLVLCLDGLDLQLVAFSAPLMLAEWGLAKTAFASVIAAAMFGMAGGTLIGGWASDRFGRERTLQLSVALFAVATMACAMARGPGDLIAWRFLGGLGFGAAFPAAAALISESLPKAAAGKAIGIVIVGIPLGGMIGAGACSVLLPMFGWRACFVGAGMLSLLYALVLLGALGRRAAPAPVAADGVDAKAGGALLSPHFRMATVGIWIAFFANSFATYSFLNWAPVLLTGWGIELASALHGSFLYNLGSIAGSIIIGWLAVAMGLQRAMGALAAVGAAGLGLFLLSRAMFPGADDPRFILWAALCVQGVCIGALQAALYILPTRIYPSAMRGRGIGTGAAFGRVGGIVSTYAGGFALDIGSSGLFFAGIGVMLLLVIVGSRLATPTQ